MGRKGVDVKIGDEFNGCVVIAEAERNQENRRRVVARCVCGKEFPVVAKALHNGNTKSCGCRKEARNKGGFNYKHGLKGTPEYRAWKQMKRRCYNLNDKARPDYGGRGISVCDRWRHDAESFVRDMGPKPSPKHSLDRIDVDGNYEPSNCRWATAREQRMNQRRMKGRT